jgi:hypothetical protein
MSMPMVNDDRGETNSKGVYYTPKGGSVAMVKNIKDSRLFCLSEKLPLAGISVDIDLLRDYKLGAVRWNNHFV